jgi:site-specific recombinase XerD
MAKAADQTVRVTSEIENKVAGNDPHRDSSLEVLRVGERAGMPFLVHAHMLRHGCGYALANKGHDTRAIQDWLGHRSIQHTVRYTELSPTRFKDFWRE